MSLNLIENIFSFMVEENDEGHGWIIKMPYTTNQRYSRSRSLADVIGRLKKLNRMYWSTHRYCFMQPYLENKMEYKVVCFNGTVEYIGSVGHSARVGGSRKAFGTPDQVIAFAQKALDTLRQRDPTTCAQGIFRVDVMYSAKRKMIVNEFESFEAVISCTDHSMTCNVLDKTAQMFESELEKFLL